MVYSASGNMSMPFLVIDPTVDQGHQFLFHVASKQALWFWWSLHLADLFPFCANFLLSSVHSSLKLSVVCLKQSARLILVSFISTFWLYSLLKPFHDHLMVLTFFLCPPTQVLSTFASIQPLMRAALYCFSVLFTQVVIYNILPPGELLFKVWYTPIEDGMSYYGHTDSRLLFSRRMNL